MEKRTITQIIVIIIGVFVLLAPIFIGFFIQVDYLLTYFFVGIGLYIIYYGFRFKDRKISKEKRERPEGLPMTNGAIVGYFGLIIFFIGLAVGVIGAYVVHTSSYFGLFVLLIAIGFVLVYVSSIIRREERRRESHRAINN